MSEDERVISELNDEEFEDEKAKTVESDSVEASVEAEVGESIGKQEFVIVSEKKPEAIGGFEKIFKATDGTTFKQSEISEVQAATADRYSSTKVYRLTSGQVKTVVELY